MARTWHLCSLKHLKNFLFYVFCFMIVAAVVIGYIGLQLPESFYYERIFLCLIFIYAIICSILFVIVLMTANKKERKQKRKPLARYLGARLRVARYMEQRMKTGDTWMEKILFLVRSSIVNNLTGCEEEERKDLEAARTMMKTLHKDLFFNENDDTAITRGEDKMLQKSVCFMLKNYLIQHPADLQGIRRCHILIGIITETIQKSDSCLSSCPGLIKCLASLKTIGSCFPSYSNILACLSICLKPLKAISSWIKSCLNPLKTCLPSCCRSSSRKKYSGKTIVMTALFIFLFTVAPFVLDNYSDIKIVSLYWHLWANSGNRSMTNIILGQSIQILPGSEIYLPVIYLSIFLGFAIFLTILTNPPKKIARQFKMAVRMKSPKVEENGEILSSASLIRRHDLSIDESGLESPFQCFWQFGIFFSLVPMIHIVTALEPTNPIFTSYDTKLKFLYDFLLSGFFSIFSLSMGQIKKKAIFQEFNTSWSQSACYFIASICSTMSFAILFIMMVSSFLGYSLSIPDYLFTSTAGKASANEKTTTAIVFLIIVFTIFIMIIGYWVTSYTGSNQDKYKLSAPMFSSIFTSTFIPFLMPTSQHITACRYNIYHNTFMESPQLLRRVADQCGVYSIFLFLAMLTNSIDFIIWSHMTLADDYVKNFLNLTNIIDVPRYEATQKKYLLPQTVLSEARRNVIIGSVSMIPAGLLFSYILLSVYFYLDNGYLSSVNMDYWFGKENKITESGTEEANEGTEGIGENNQLLLVRAEDSVHVLGEEEANGIDATYDISGDKIDEPTNDKTQKKSCWDQLQNWIDKDAKEWNMAGSWMDLTGDAGLEGYCEDGTSVLNGVEGTLEYTIRMSFPFYRNPPQKKISRDPASDIQRPCLCPALY